MQSSRFLSPERGEPTGGETTKFVRTGQESTFTAEVDMGNGSQVITAESRREIRSLLRAAVKLGASYDGITVIRKSEATYSVVADGGRKAAEVDDEDNSEE